jgi:hypothetical protein
MMEALSGVIYHFIDNEFVPGAVETRAVAV